MLYISLGMLTRQELSPASQFYKKVRAPILLEPNHSELLRFTIQFIPNFLEFTNSFPIGLIHFVLRGLFRDAGVLLPVLILLGFLSRFS
jgi:hypothetical protein